MKAIISNKIYMVVDSALHRKLEKELTYKVPSYSDPNEFVSIKTLKVINFNVAGGNLLVAFPAGRTDLIPAHYVIEDKRSYNYIEDFPEFKYQLRPSQQEICDDVTDNCLINAKVGFGKTFTALAIAAKLKQKTLVVVHTVALRNQWEKEIVKTLGITPGVIGSGKFNINSPIVVANIQSIVKYIPEINREFGALFLDEVHHVSSPTFSKVVDAMFCRYKIGLSGTLQRKDQKHVVFKDYFGHKVYIPPAENTMTPKVNVIESGIHFSDYNSASWAEKINILTQSRIYQDLVVALANKYSREGHKVLVVSDRVEFLRECCSRSNAKSELLVGGLKDYQREELIQKISNGESQELWATQSLASEGLSINPLSCLILGTPVNNEPLLEQLIGRITRLSEGKLTPIIVDIKLLGNTVTKQFNNRLGHYMKQNYQIEFIK